MNIRRRAVAVAALLAVFVASCGTDEPASLPTPDPTPEATPTPLAPSPTPDATPTRGPLDLVTEDPGANPDAFLAALPADEVACAESAVGGRAVVTEVMSSFDSSEGSLVSAEDVEAVVGCLGEETIKGILIGQIDRMAGGLSGETVSCMTNYATPPALVSAFTFGEPVADGFRDLSSLIFCSNASERAALETSGSEMLVEQRAGFIDSLECAFESRDADGNPLIVNTLPPMPPDEEGESSDPEAIRTDWLIASYEFIPIAVECGMTTDEDFEGTGFTAEQYACMVEESGDSLLAFIGFTINSATGMPYSDELTELASTFDACGVEAEQLPQLPGS